MIALILSLLVLLTCGCSSSDQRFMGNADYERAYRRATSQRLSYLQSPARNAAFSYRDLKREHERLGLMPYQDFYDWKNASR